MGRGSFHVKREPQMRIGPANSPRSGEASPPVPTDVCLAFSAWPIKAMPKGDRSGSVAEALPRMAMPFAAKRDPICVAIIAGRGRGQVGTAVVCRTPQIKGWAGSADANPGGRAAHLSGGSGRTPDGVRGLAGRERASLMNESRSRSTAAAGASTWAWSWSRRPGGSEAPSHIALRRQRCDHKSEARPVPGLDALNVCRGTSEGRPALE
jgi:hypothetical protein